MSQAAEKTESKTHKALDKGKEHKLPVSRLFGTRFSIKRFRVEVFTGLWSTIRFFFTFSLRNHYEIKVYTFFLADYLKAQFIS